MTEGYAARILYKYGWKQGKGLGKEQQGISKPIALASQDTTEGIGYQASLFEPWWDKLFDKAAANIDVKGAETKKLGSRSKPKPKPKLKSKWGIKIPKSKQSDYPISVPDPSLHQEVITIQKTLPQFPKRKKRN